MCVCVCLQDDACKCIGYSAFVFVFLPHAVLTLLTDSVFACALASPGRSVKSTGEQERWDVEECLRQNSPYAPIMQRC